MDTHNLVDLTLATAAIFMLACSAGIAMSVTLLWRIRKLLVDGVLRGLQGPPGEQGPAGEPEPERVPVRHVEIERRTPEGAWVHDHWVRHDSPASQKAFDRPGLRLRYPNGDIDEGVQ